jgi:hypothetical protein
MIGLALGLRRLVSRYSRAGAKVGVGAGIVYGPI